MRESRLLGRSGGARWLRSSILSSRTLRRRQALAERAQDRQRDQGVRRCGAAAPEGLGCPSMAAPTGRPSPLPTFIRFIDLKAAGIVNNHCALENLIDDHQFLEGEVARVGHACLDAQ